MKKKMLVAAGVTLSTLALLTACSGSPGTAGSDAGGEAETCSGGEVVWYTAASEGATRVAAAFEEKTGVKVQMLTASAGELVTRVEAEKDNPKGDVFTVGSDNSEILRGKDLIRQYESPARADIDPQYYDADGWWTGVSLSTISLGVNTTLWEEELGDAPFPESWDDVLGSEFEGEIVMPNPTTSGTGFNFVATQIFRLGEEGAWEFLDAFNKNVGEYTTSGGAPSQLIASGEYMLGVSFSHDLLRVASAGFPVMVVFPKPTGYEISATSIIKDGPNSENAECFVDFQLSKEAQTITSDLIHVNPTRADVPIAAGGTPLDEIELVDFDGTEAAAMRESVLDEFTTRFAP